MERHVTAVEGITISHPEIDDLRVIHHNGPMTRHSSVALGNVNDLKTEAQISAALTYIEPRTRLNIDVAFERALELEHLAGKLGFERQRMRAQLVISDVQMRRGQGAPGALTAEGIRDWAQDHQDNYLLARSNRVLAQFYWRLGDQALALECVVHGVRLLTQDDDLTVIAEHRIALADALCTTASFDAARAEYDEAIRMCEQLNNVQLQLSAMNNLAYTCSRRGDVAEALDIATQMTELSENNQQELHVTWIDTIARIKMAMGQYDEALAMLAPIVNHPENHMNDQILGLAECLLAYAEVLRKLDRLPEAEFYINQCEELVEDANLELLRISLLREQASVAAENQLFEQAYTYQRAAFDLAIDLRSDERDAKARSLLIMHQTSTAQADRAKFKRLSLIDPLTSLGNRRFVNDCLAQTLAYAAHTQQTVAVALFDLDHFKKINDTWSHSVGDQVLQEISAILARSMGMKVAPGRAELDSDAPWDIDIEHCLTDPTQGFAARLGGEEFLLVAPGLSAVSAQELMEGILKSVRENDWRKQVPVGAVTGSIGLVLSHGDAEATQLMRGADELLYLAKEQGRDRVVGPGIITNQ